MRYGVVLSSAWNALWRAWALWGVLAAWMGASALVILGLAASFAGLLVNAAEGGGPEPLLVGALSIGAVLAAVALIPLSWFSKAASIHLANEALSGRPVRFSDGIGAARGRFGALAGFELILMVIMGGFVLVVGGLFAVVFGGVIASTGGGDEAIAAIFGLVCCFYAFVIALSIFGGIVVQAFEAVGARAAVLSGRRGTEAFKDAWSVLKGSFKTVFVMGLIILGVSWVYSFFVSIFTTPIMLLFYPQMMLTDPAALEADPTRFLGMMSTLYVVLGLATTVLNFPLMVFIVLVWTGFYRQLVGLEPAEEAFAPAPVAPAPPDAFPPPPPAADGES